MLKKLRIGFAAVIALLALTATVASHAGAFNNKIAKAAAPNGCYDFVQNTDTPTPVTLQSGQPSSTPLPANRVVNTLTLGSIVPNPTELGDCPPNPEVICCIQIANDRITSFVFGDLQP